MSRLIGSQYTASLSDKLTTFTSSGTWVAGGVWGYKQVFKQTVEGTWR